MRIPERLQWELARHVQDRLYSFRENDANTPASFYGTQFLHHERCRFYLERIFTRYKMTAGLRYRTLMGENIAY